MRRPARLRTLVVVAALVTGAATGAAAAAGLTVRADRATITSVAATMRVSNCSVVASADATVEQALPTTNANGPTLGVRSALGDSRSFVRFDLSSCALPVNADVQTATLTLLTVNLPGVGRTHVLHRVTGAWTETGVTWNTQPPVAATATGSLTTSALLSRSFDVTDDLRLFATGAASNLGWRISDPDPADGSVIAAYASRDAALQTSRPTLAISWMA
jgi:hypothetical protein